MKMKYLNMESRSLVAVENLEKKERERKLDLESRCAKMEVEETD